MEIPLEGIHVHKVIGKGSYATVYSGLCRENFVSIKELRPSSRGLQSMERFLSEAEILSKAQHPNIIRFMGFCRTADSLLIISELAVNGSVKDKLFRREFPLLERLIMARDVARAMAWIHPSIIHRDLKLENILLSEDLTVKVTDFGLSIISAGADQSISGQIGTLMFMAPEILLNKSYDHKVDVYSFSLVLWEFIMQKRAFLSDSPTSSKAWAAAILQGHRPPIGSTLPSGEAVSPLLLYLLRQCWDADPSSRPEFSQITETLDKIIVETAIDDPLGREFWLAFFRGQEDINLPLFEQNFEQYLTIAGIDQPVSLSLEQHIDPAIISQRLLFATDEQMQALIQENAELFETFIRQECQRRYGSSQIPQNPGTPEINRSCLRRVFSLSRHLSSSSSSSSPSSSSSSLSSSPSPMQMSEGSIRSNFEAPSNPSPPTNTTTDDLKMMIVTVGHFGKMLRYFGPIREQSGNVLIVDRIRRILRSGWFFGSLSTDDSYVKLVHTLSFLIRLSTSSLGCFTISRSVFDHQTHETQVLHERILYCRSGIESPNCGEGSYLYRDTVFPTLDALIASCNSPTATVHLAWDSHTLSVCGGSPFLSLFQSSKGSYLETSSVRLL